MKAAWNQLKESEEKRQLPHSCFLDVCLRADVGIYSVYLFFSAALGEKLRQILPKVSFKQDAAFVKIPIQSWMFSGWSTTN